MKISISRIKGISNEFTNFDDSNDCKLSKLLLNKLPPANSILPKKTFIYDLPNTGIGSKLLKIDKFNYDFIEIESPSILLSQTAINNPDEIIPSTLNGILLKHFRECTLVYERYYSNSIPHILREEYFFTEIVNIKRLMALSYGSEYQTNEFNPYLNSKDSYLESPSHTEENLNFDYRKLTENEYALAFESNFECGNLCTAFKVNENEYNLFIQNDTNTNGHTQWFFFRVTNTIENKIIKFNILNFAKDKSLYEKGMRICIYSIKMHSLENKYWHHDGFNVKYFENGIRKKNINSAKSFYTLSFYYKFKYTDDTVYFSYSYPFSYSDLNNYMHEVEQINNNYKIMKRKTFCQTIAGNNCDYLSITSQEPKLPKKIVVLTSRVHPGETTGSWMMKGVIDFLTANSEEAQILRENFIFKIIPMLNPDGVINGNNRSSLAGCDLNRVWNNPNSKIHPTIYNLKQMIKSWNSTKDVVLFCDLHGHSKFRNSFMYGCKDEKNDESTKLFPYILSQINDNFYFDQCIFENQDKKENTSRITLWRELKIPNVFTLEASFFGKGKKHFQIQDYLQIGFDLCKAIMIYFNIIPNSILNKTYLSGFRIQKNIGVNTEMILTDISEPQIDFSKMIKKIKKLGMKQPREDSFSGSENELSDDNFNPQILKLLLPINLNKIKITDLQKLKLRKSFEITSPILKKTGNLSLNSPIKKKLIAKPVTSTKNYPGLRQKTENKMIQTVENENLLNLQ